MMTTETTMVRVKKIIVKDKEKLTKFTSWKDFWENVVNEFNEADGDLMLEVTPCLGDDVKTALMLGDFDYVYPESNPQSENLRILLTSTAYYDALELDVDYEI